MGMFNPFSTKQHLTPTLLCIHYQRNIWILGRVFSFHIHAPGKGTTSNGLVASKYAPLELKSPLEDPFQARLSPLLDAMGRGTALMLSLMSKGKSKGMADQFHPWGRKTSLTFRLVDSRGIGPWMMDLRGPKSNQKSKLLSCPGIHFVPALNTCSPFFKPFQIGDLGNLASFLELRPCLVPYFSLSTLTQGAFSSE